MCHGLRRVGESWKGRAGRLIKEAAVGTKHYKDFTAISVTFTKSFKVRANDIPVSHMKKLRQRETSHQVTGTVTEP